MDELFGKVVRSVWVNDDNTLMVFRFDGGELAYRAFADCCSETWFSSLTGLTNLLGHIVTRVTLRPELYLLPSERQLFDSLYGYFLETLAVVGLYPERGVCEIEFRNASNGYYGGSCELIESYTDALTEVKADFPGNWNRDRDNDDADLPGPG